MQKVLKFLNIMKGALSMFIAIPLAYLLLVMAVSLALVVIVLAWSIEKLPRAKQLRSCRQAERAIGSLVRVSLTSNQRSALISFVYNVGSGNFQRSTMRMKLNRHDYDGCANEFWKWRRAGGRILNGLVRRRKSEEQLFKENKNDST